MPARPGVERRPPAASGARLQWLCPRAGWTFYHFYMANVEDKVEREARRVAERGDFGPVMFDDRDSFGIIKAILNLRRRKA